VRDRDMGHKV